MSELVFSANRSDYAQALLFQRLQDSGAKPLLVVWYDPTPPLGDHCPR
jgi:hypothetical protein